jgi:hypothetical protein
MPYALYPREHFMLLRTAIAVFEDWLEQCPHGVQLCFERAQKLVQLTQMSDQLLLQKLRVHPRCGHALTDIFKSVQGFNSIQENHPRITASQQGCAATNTFEIGKSFRQYVGAKSRVSSVQKTENFEVFEFPKVGCNFP